MIVIAVAFGAFTYRSLENRLTKEIVDTLSRRAHVIIQTILQRTPIPSPENISRQIQAVFSPEARGRFIRLSKQGGTNVYVSGLPSDNRFNPDDIPTLKTIPAETTTRVETLGPKTNMLLVTVPEKINNEWWLVEIGLVTDEIETALHELLLTLMISLPFVVITAATGGYFLVQHSLRPVEDIRATAEQITFGNLSNRLPVAPSGDAIESLSITLNHMLERLETAYMQASRFSADASHELRTPLTIMRTELESIVQESALDEALRERIGVVLEETEYLSRIAESLFAISRLDSGEAKMENITCNLADIVLSTSEQMHLLAEENQILVDIDVLDPVQINADRTRIKQVVVNLLDNAIKYTPRGGKIHIRVFSTDTKAILEIRDNGVGISQDALPHVFERFYRDNSSSSKAIRGAGIGLSIVRSVVQAHGGSISINSVEHKGTRVTIELPRVRI